MGVELANPPPVPSGQMVHRSARKGAMLRSSSARSIAANVDSANPIPPIAPGPDTAHDSITPRTRRTT